jgi:hypothetical protein
MVAFRKRVCVEPRSAAAFANPCGERRGNLVM